MTTATPTAPDFGSRASGQVRLAELLWAAISGRPGGLRETTLLLLATTATGVERGEWETWKAVAVDKALHRLMREGYVRPVDEPEGRRWVAA